MRLAIRVDASVHIGTGHLMRCLAVAGEAGRRGHEVAFAMHDPAAPIAALVREAGWGLHTLSDLGDADRFRRAIGPCDAVLVDHYGLDARWEREVSDTVIVIDDLADRDHACRILIDQNPYPAADVRYRERVPDDCRMLLGPCFAMLREEFSIARATAMPRTGEVTRILVFYGGTDPTAETEKAVAALAQVCPAGVAVDVVVGGGNPRLAAVAAAVGQYPNMALHVQTEQMARLTAAATLALGAGGSAVLERCYLGLPSIVTVTADNQVELTDAIVDAGAVTLLGDTTTVDIAALEQAVRAAFDRSDLLAAQSRAGMAIFGSSERSGTAAIVDAIEEVA